MKTSSIAYQLKYDDSWLYDIFGIPDDADEEDVIDFAVWLDEFPGCENVSFKLLPPPGIEVYYPIGGGQYGTIPKPLVFYGYHRVINQIDYPYNDRQWAMMSKGMLHTLLSVRDFPHRAFPVEIIDVESASTIGGEISEIVNHDFVIVQLTTHLDVFDWEQSEYTLVKGTTDRVDRAKKVVFKEPEEGFPPLFQISVYKSRLFVSHAGKTVLENAGITGARFIPLEKVTF
jgi:hypothetical protein